MNLRTRSSILLLVLAAASGSAQETGTLRLLIDPGHDFSFIVDHKHRMQQREVKLSEGLHHFSFWAPTRVIVDTTVFVIANRASDLILRLPYSEEYATYRRDLGNYTNARRLRNFSPVVLLGGMVWTGLSISSYTKAKDQLNEDRSIYANSVDPGIISRLKHDLIPEHNNDLRKARTSLYASAAVTSIAAIAAGYIRYRTRGMQRPSFEDKEKILFDGLSWMPNEHGGVWCVGMTIPLRP